MNDYRSALRTRIAGWTAATIIIALNIFLLVQLALSPVH